LAAFNDFAFAAHPAHEAFPALCRAANGQKIVGGQTNGRDRCEIRGAVDPEQGSARIIEVPTVDAWRRIAPLTAIAVMGPFKGRIQAYIAVQESKNERKRIGSS